MDIEKPLEIVSGSGRRIGDNAKSSGQSEELTQMSRAAFNVMPDSKLCASYARSSLLIFNINLTWQASQGTVALEITKGLSYEVSLGLGFLSLTVLQQGGPSFQVGS